MYVYFNPKSVIQIPCIRRSQLAIKKQYSVSVKKKCVYWRGGICKIQVHLYTKQKQTHRQKTNL